MSSHDTATPMLESAVADAEHPGDPTPSDSAHPAPGTVGTVLDPATADLPRPGSVPTPAQRQAAAKDKALTAQAAIDRAHEALSEITDPLSVGAYVGARAQEARVVTHLFDCTLAGYRGWRWAVTVTRPPRSRTATVCELELLPGEDALLAPTWVPWADRLQPGDVSRSDRLPRRETDERLEPGWEATDEDSGDVVGTDALDFGRARVLSAHGVHSAAQRWYDGDHGPGAEGVRKAHATCSTCGFFMPLAGPLRNVFGICANEWAADDGRVVSLDHGCGAHSETDVPDQGPAWPVTPSRLDESAMEPVGTDGQSLREGRSQEEETAAHARRVERARQRAERLKRAAEEAGGAGEPLQSADASDPAGAPLDGGAQAAGQPEGAQGAEAPVKARRGGRSRTRARAKASAPQVSAAEAVSDSLAELHRAAEAATAAAAEGPAEAAAESVTASATQGGEEPTGQAGASAAAEPGTSTPTDATGTADAAGRSQAAPARRRRRATSAAAARERAAGSATDPSGPAPQPSAPAEPDDEDTQRHAAALDAVAELAAAHHGEAAGSARHVPPATLAELEAQLPFGQQR